MKSDLLNQLADAQIFIFQLEEDGPIVLMLDLSFLIFLLLILYLYKLVCVSYYKLYLQLIVEFQLILLKQLLLFEDPFTGHVLIIKLALEVLLESCVDCHLFGLKFIVNISSANGALFIQYLGLGEDVFDAMEAKSMNAFQLDWLDHYM